MSASSIPNPLLPDADAMRQSEELITIIQQHYSDRGTPLSTRNAAYLRLGEFLSLQSTEDLLREFLVEERPPAHTLSPLGAATDSVQDATDGGLEEVREEDIDDEYSCMLPSESFELL